MQQSNNDERLFSKQLDELIQLYLLITYYNLINLDLSNEIGVGGVSGRRSKHCPKATRFGNGHRGHCDKPTDPNNLPASLLEKWFTKEMFNVSTVSYSK
jgi:hypothetical protein